LTRPQWKDEAQSRGIHYDVRVEGAPAAVEGRPEELWEVFTNLLVNAL
jgi:signal transduction histidine kinase